MPHWYVPVLSVRGLDCFLWKTKVWLEKVSVQRILCIAWKRNMCQIGSVQVPCHNLRNPADKLHLSRPFQPVCCLGNFLHKPINAAFLTHGQGYQLCTPWLCKGRVRPWYERNGIRGPQRSFPLCICVCLGRTVMERKSLRHVLVREKC